MTNKKRDFRNIKSTQFDASQTAKMEFSELHSAKRVLPTNNILKDGYTHFKQVLDGNNRPTQVTYYQAIDSTIDRLTFRADVGGDLAGEYYVLTNPVDNKTYAIYQVVSGLGNAPGVADVELPVNIANNDSAEVVSYSNKLVLDTIEDITILTTSFVSAFRDIEYTQFGVDDIIDVTTSGFTVTRTKPGESIVVGEIELEYDVDGNIIWQDETLKNAVYDPYKAEFNFPVRSALTDEDGNPYSPDNPLSVQLSDGQVNIGTVNAELEVQLSRQDNNPDAGDVHDSVRIGNQNLELGFTDLGNGTGEAKTQARIHVEVDLNNSTDTPLLDGQSFEGTWTRRTNPTMIMAPTADQNFNYYAQFANSEQDIIDGNIDSNIPYLYETGIYVPRRLAIAREWYRIVIDNTSGSDMTELRFQTSVGDFPVLASKLNATLRTDADAEVVRAVIAGQDPDGNYNNVGLDRDNNLNVNLPSETFGNKILSADRSVFGSGVTEPIQTELSVDFSGGIREGLFEETITGSGSINASNAKMILSTGITQGSTILKGTRDTVRYRPGREMRYVFTALFKDLQDSADIANIGPFNDDDGYYISYRNSTLNIVIKRDGVESVVSQSSFSEDLLDGNGESIFTRNDSPEAIDPTKLNVFRVRYGWLGSASVYFDVLSPDGNWVTFHINKHANSDEDPHSFQPSLPVRAYIEKNGTGVYDAQLHTASWTGQYVGAYKGGTVSSANTSTTPLGAGATFTGKGVETLDYVQINVNYYADQDAAENGVRFQFSPNGDDWFDATPDFNYVVGEYRTFQLGIYGRFFRVVYTNGSIAQSQFSIETILLSQQSLTSLHRVDSPITDDRSVNLVKAVITGKQPDGDYVNVPADGIAVDVDGVTVKSNTPLLASESYQSGWVDTDGYKSIELSITSDQLSTVNGIVIEYTDDANVVTPTVISTKTFTYAQTDVDTGSLTLFIPPRVDGFRITYTNGINPQSIFNIEATLRTSSLQPVSLPITSPIVDSTNGEVVRSVVSGRLVDANLEPTANYGNAELTSNNSLKTQSVHEVLFKYATPDDASIPSDTPVTINPIINLESNVVDTGWIPVREFKVQDFHIKTDQPVRVFVMNASDELGNNIQGNSSPALITTAGEPANIAARFFDDYFRVLICNDSGSTVTEITARSTGGNGIIQPVDVSIDQPVFGFFPAPLTQNVSKGRNPDGIYESLRIQGVHTANTTSTPLNGDTGGSDHIFRGEWFPWQENYIKLVVDFIADQPGTLYVDLSEENNPVDGDESSVTSFIVNVYDPVLEGLFRRQYPVQSRWVRVRYENGLAAQSVFTLDSSFLVTDPGLVTQNASELPLDNNLAGLTRSIQTIRDASGSGFQDVPVRPDTGNPKTSVEEIHDDILLKPLTEPKFSQITLGIEPVRIDPSPVSDRRGTLIKNTGQFSCAIGTSDSITFESESYVLIPGDHVVLPFSEDTEYWGIVEDTGGTQTTLTRSGTTAVGSATNPSNALTSNNIRATINANSETVEVSGFTAGTTNDIVSVALGVEASKESGQFETTAWVDTVGVDVGNVGSIQSPTVTANSDHLYLVAVSTNEPGTTVTSVSSTMGFTDAILVGDSDDFGGDSAESRTHVFRMTGTPVNGDGTISVTFSETAGHAVIAVTRISGADLANPIDSIDVFNDNSQQNYSGTLSSATDQGLYFGAFGSEIETHNTATTPAGAVERFQDGSTTNNDQTLAIVTGSITATGSLGYSGSYTGSNDISYVVAAIKPRVADSPTINVSYELSAVTGATDDSFTLDSTSDVTNEVDVSSDRAWVSSDIPNIEIFVTGEDISAAAALIDYVYVKIVDATGNVTKVSVIQGGRELLP